MRLLPIVAVASVLLLACQCKKTSKQKPPGSPPSTASLPVAIDASPQIAKHVAPEALSDAELEAFITELFDRDVAAYSEKTQSAIWCDSYHFEGDGVTTVHLKKQGEEGEEIYEFQIGYDEYADQQAKAAKAVGARLRKDNFVRLKKTDWESEDDKILVKSINREFVWNEMTLSIAAPGKEPVKLSEYQVSEPHVPGATAVFAGTGVPVVVVEITYDPGSEYIDGYTVNRTMEVFAIPE